MYYGFQTEEEWLIYYTKTHRDAYDMPISRSSVFNIGYAIDILKIQTGIKTLSGEPVYAMGDIPENGVSIVAVCSNLKSSFEINQVKHRWII